MLLAPSCAAPRIFPGRQWVKSGRTSYTAQLGVGVSRGARDQAWRYSPMVSGATQVEGNRALRKPGVLHALSLRFHGTFAQVGRLWGTASSHGSEGIRRPASRLGGDWVDKPVGRVTPA